MDNITRRVVTGCVFGILMLVIIFQGIYIKGNPRPDGAGVVGTFATGNWPGDIANAHYVVFERDGVCAHYMQLGDVTYGTYTVEGDAVSMAFPEDTVCAVHSGDTLYLFSPDAGRAIPFERLSQTPIYINVPSRPPAPQ